MSTKLRLSSLLSLLECSGKQKSPVLIWYLDGVLEGQFLEYSLPSHSATLLVQNPFCA